MLRLVRRLFDAAGPPMTPRAALKVLALSPSAELNHGAIKKAYVQQTLRCHPDLYPNDPEATDKFRNLSDALRVALRALEVRQGLANGKSGWHSAASDGTYDSQAVLEALRRAIVTYRQHHELSSAVAARQHGDVEAEPSSPQADKETEEAAADRMGAEDAAFFSPSLEYVSAVCRREALAMRRVRGFCEELPAVLCGSSSAALFEAVAFFHARYVEATSACVMRFAKDLPVIVRRVVKHRKKHVRNTHSKSTTGFATGSRPREQRIEDMAMKPLVLVGALIFDLPERDRGAAQGQDRKRSTQARDEEVDNDDDGSVTSTCGVSRPADITVSDELKCTIYPADSIATITEKLGRWEAASYDRLKLELAVVDACVFLSSMLNLSPEGGDRSGDGSSGGGVGGGNALTMVPHLHLGHKITERVLLTLQKLSCSLCDAFDDALDHRQVRSREGTIPQAAAPDDTVSADDKLDAILGCLGQHEVAERQKDYCAMEAKSSEDDRHAAECLPLPVLIAECRRLATLAAPGLKGNVNVSWGEDSELVTTAEELVGNGEHRENSSHDAGEGSSPGKPGFSVGRHSDCCAAEMIEFAVAVDLCKDLRVFLLRLRQALKTVVLEYEKGHAVLDEVLRVRDTTIHEEFIPEPPTGNGEATPKETCTSADREAGDEKVPGSPDEDQRYRYRGPVFNFVRLYNMVTSRELLFWQLLHRHREYLAKHAASMNMMNVYLDCLPGSPGSSQRNGHEENGSGGVVSGWIGESTDENGTWDSVVLTTAELEDPANLTSGGDGGAFRQWLEDVVEQSSLNKECRTILDEAGVGYVRRDAALPLTNYLSFVKVFVQAAAVRSVLEGRQVTSAATTTTATTAASTADSSPPIVGSEDVGITLIVGHTCDVRDGGRLLVPWSMDPNVLIALLTDGAATTPKLPE